jgi:O-antigen/teichoic acid export membrane protein
LKGALSVLAFVIGLGMSRSLIGAAGGMAAGWWATFLLFDFPAGRRFISGSLRPAFAVVPMRELFFTALPLGIGLVLISLATNVPRYFVAHHRGEEDVGIYSAIANLTLASMSVMMALCQVMAPRLSRAYASRDLRGYVRLVRHLTTIGLVLGLLGIVIAVVAGAPVLRLVYTSEFASAAPVFVIVMIAGLTNNLLCACGFIVNAAGLFRPQVPLQLFNLISLVIACALLVPETGILGAAWATVVASALNVIAGFGLVLHGVRKLRPKMS